MSGLYATGYIIVSTATQRGIVAIRANPDDLASAGRQIADDLSRILDDTAAAQMSAVELADQAASAARAAQDTDPTLGSIGFVGSAAFGTAVGVGLSPFLTPLGGAAAGFVAGKIYDLLFNNLRDAAQDFWTGEYGGDPILSPEEMPTQVNDGFLTAANWRPPARDPLAIDLDGDGIETVGIAATDPIVFDHNADGIRTGTGWVSGDDAWLVLDRNGNGSIDSGRELFGVDTVLSGTPGLDASYAATGFEALAILDANADAVFDAQDAAFAQVRLWRDANQDGVSQAGELSTLSDQGIASIALNATTTSTNLGNGNTVTGTATVTRTNGSTTLAETVNVASDMTAANLTLANNPFYREFTDSIAWTPAAALPEMRGSGRVRHLREAMSRGRFRLGARSGSEPVSGRRDARGAMRRARRAAPDLAALA